MSADRGRATEHAVVEVVEEPPEKEKPAEPQPSEQGDVYPEEY